MPCYKTFSSASDVTALARMEREINEWMEREHPRILHMAQSSSQSARTPGEHLTTIVVSFVYDHAGSESLGAAMAATSIPDVFERTLEDADLDPATTGDNVLLPEAELPY
ncbi:MAG TPA: hypothetical protein VKQ30_13715 [Ktedonobacterales bacterium]|nr:hypothetical protein [Ktedonobacterales bacterium]